VVITTPTEKRIHVYNLKTREEEYNIPLKVELTSVSVTRDSRYMLINRSDNEVQLLDIASAEVVQRFVGQKQGNFVIRSTLGGAAENFVVSGSEGELQLPSLDGANSPLTPRQTRRSTSGMRATVPWWPLSRATALAASIRYHGTQRTLACLHLAVTIAKSGCTCRCSVT
jgi:WD40 repeat protein